MEVKVSYEICIKNSKTSYYRLGKTLIDYKAELVNSYKLSKEADPVILVRLNPEQIEQFKQYLKPIYIKYRSPTYFDNSQLVPIYASAEDEVVVKAEKAIKKTESRKIK